MKLMDACPQIYFGDQSLDALAELPQGKIMLICDPFMLQSGIARKVTDRLDRYNRRYIIFDGVKPDPSIQTVRDGLQILFREKPDIIIALGGGSAIDTSKAVLYFCLKYKMALMDPKYVHKLYFVAIPTTSGTGSEVTSYTVLTDTENETKIPLTDRLMVPDVAILCAEFTKTLPKAQIAFTGMDVLTHATEAYVSNEATTFTDTYAIRAAINTLHYLPLLYAGDTSDKNHEEMMLASTMAGIAFNNSGLGVCHGLAHTIGAEFHLPHGMCNAIILPWVIAFNAGTGIYQSDAAQQVATRKRYQVFAENLGFKEEDNLINSFIKTVIALNDKFEIPSNLSASSISRQDFERELESMIPKIMQDMTTQANPVPITESDVRMLLNDVFEGHGPL